MKIVGIIITIAIIIGIGIITYNDDSVLMKTDTGIIIETNSGINNDKLELIESELPIIEPIIESELPIIEPIIEPELISITEPEPEPEPVWTIPIKKTTQTLIEPIQEIKKIIEEPKEFQPISKSDIVLIPTHLQYGVYKIHNTNPDQAIDGVLQVHIIGQYPLIYKNIRIQPDSTYYGATEFIGGCDNIGDGVPFISCEKQFIFAFYDMKIPRNAHPMTMQDWQPLNQCEDCNGIAFNQYVGEFEYRPDNPFNYQD